MLQMAVPDGTTAEELVKEIYWLAWQASRVYGMGYLQDHPTATREDIWNNVATKGDYTVGDGLPSKGVKNSEAHADYVFGRMMKLFLRWKDGRIECPSTLPDREYQSWATTYTSYPMLVNAAIMSLTKKLTRNE